MAKLIDTYQINALTGERKLFAVNTSGTPEKVQAFYQSQVVGKVFSFASQYREA
jgi:hypothetical protein